MRERITKSEAETLAFARELARELVPGDVLAFRGGLGAGKTAFIRGLAEGLGIGADVTSPTFALVHEYHGEGISLYHFDMYRVGGYDSLCSTGFFDYLDMGGILAAEWSENIAEYLPPESIFVTMEHAGGDIRRITLEGGRF